MKSVVLVRVRLVSARGARDRSTFYDLPSCFGAGSC